MKDLSSKKPILTSKEALIYGLGIMGVQLGIGLVNSYQAEFFNKIFSANLMAVAAIILGAKVISIFADFIIGNLIDRSKFKGGKMRPWIFISAFPFIIFTMLSFVFVPFKSVAVKYIYIIVITILWNVSMSLADIPSQGMLALLSPDANERNMAAGIANTLKSVGLAAPGVFATVVCMITGNGTVGKIEYLITAGIICVVGLGLFLLIYFCNKEKVVSTSTTLSLKQTILELKNNKMLLIVFLTFLLGFGRNIGMSIAVQATTILMREGVTLPILGFSTGDKVSWILGLTSALSSMISIIAIPFINKKWGEKKTFIVFGIYGFAISLLVFILYATGVAALRTAWAILVYQLFVGFSFGPHGYLPMVMTSDIVDYQEWKTGKRTEGSAFAVLSLSNKLSNALSISVAIFLVGAINYSSNEYFTYVSGNTVNPNIVNYITDAMQTKLFAIFILLPGICMLISSIPMLWYKIDEPIKKAMREELTKRRAEKN